MKTSAARFLKRFSTVTYNRKGEQPNVAPKIDYQMSKTSQGVTVVTQDHRGPAANVALYIAKGSSSDTPENPGVAHVFKRSLVRVGLC
jgi:predicted Zn-dependent peptidase